METKLLDAIIIGSGFGGSVHACRLAQSGFKVVVLERGRRWKPEEYPRDLGDAWVYDIDEPQRQNGWIDFCLLYTSPSPRDRTRSRMPSSA